MGARWSLLLAVGTFASAAAGLSPSAPASAQDEEPGIELGYPLQTRRPVIERELEFRVDSQKGSDGRLTAATLGIEMPILPRWQVELEVPASSASRTTSRRRPARAT